jgi:hypothetical protein
VGAASYDPEHPIPLESLIAEADRRMRRPSDNSDTPDIQGT